MSDGGPGTLQVPGPLWFMKGHVPVAWSRAASEV